MTIEDNKAVARRFFAALSRGDIDGTGALMAEDHVFYFPLLPEPADKAAHIAGQRALVAAIPNFHETVVDQFAEGDLVFNRLHMTGTRTGAMMGVPGGGQTVELSVFNVMRIRDGLIVDEWDEFDTLSFLVQLGIIAKPVFGHVGD